VFIFRLEPKSAQSGSESPPPATADGLIPVIYRVDLRDPRSLFWIQSFPVKDRDVLYVSNAPVWELQKFMNLLFTLAYPVQTGVQLSR
jgi:polysaccharide export outer membrane protein